MKFNADRILMDREGKPIKEPVPGSSDLRSITHGIIAVRAIDASLPQDKDLKAEDVRTRFALGSRIMSGGIVELTPAEAAFIQERVCIFSVPIAGQIIESLDGKQQPTSVPSQFNKNGETWENYVGSLVSDIKPS